MLPVAYKRRTLDLIRCLEMQPSTSVSLRVGLSRSERRVGRGDSEMERYVIADETLNGGTLRGGTLIICPEGGLKEREAKHIHQFPYITHFHFGIGMLDLWKVAQAMVAQKPVAHFDAE